MSLSFSNKPEYELLKEVKKQEVFIENAEIKRTERSQKQFISIKFRIRDDIEQENAGRIIFDTIWEERDNPGVFDTRKISSLLQSQGENGKYNFEDYDELVQYINGLSMIITIEVKPADDFRDEPYNQVKYCSYKPSESKPKTLGASTNNINTQQSSLRASDVVYVDDTDLPF